MGRQLFALIFCLWAIPVSACIQAPNWLDFKDLLKADLIVIGRIKQLMPEAAPFREVEFVVEKQLHGIETAQETMKFLLHDFGYRTDTVDETVLIEGQAYVAVLGYNPDFGRTEFTAYVSRYNEKGERVGDEDMTLKTIPFKSPITKYRWNLLRVGCGGPSPLIFNRDSDMARAIELTFSGKWEPEPVAAFMGKIFRLEGGNGF